MAVVELGAIWLIGATERSSCNPQTEVQGCNVHLLPSLWLRSCSVHQLLSLISAVAFAG